MRFLVSSTLILLAAAVLGLGLPYAFAVHAAPTQCSSVQDAGPVM